MNDYFDESNPTGPGNNNGCCPVGLAAIILFFLLMSMCMSCTHLKYVPVESVRTEYRDKLIRDSIYMKDSIYIHQKGDTVIAERWRTKYIEKLRVDSFIKIDSVQVPYPVEVIKKVEKDLNWWQSIKMNIGGMALWFLVFILIYFIFKIVKSVKSVGWKAALKLIFKTK